MKALQFERSLPRFAAARVAGMVVPGRGGGVGPLRLVDTDAPPQPGASWLRVRPRLCGICGSDLATIDARSSRWFEPIVSFPFVPGHEVVVDTPDGGRAVLEPVLGCATRGVTPPCAACAGGDLGRCERITFGAIDAGLQTGFCCSTGGGWATELWAHPSQLHAVPDELTDEDAVLVEPMACAVHAALAPGALDGAAVAVIGAGTLGLGVIAALTRWNAPKALVAVAKHPEQRRHARALGATHVGEPAEALRLVRRVTGSLAVGDGGVERLTGGADVVFDCAGTADSLTTALAMTRPGGRIVLVGMPGEVRIDLTPLWQREIALIGAYAYGTERTTPAHRRTFDLAFELVAAHSLGTLVSATYPLARYEEALRHAAAAGRRGAVKVAFDLRGERGR